MIYTVQTVIQNNAAPNPYPSWNSETRHIRPYIPTAFGSWCSNKV